MPFTSSGEQTIDIAIEAEDNASGAFESVGSSATGMKQAVGGAGAALGTAGVAAFGAATKAAVKFEDQMMDVQKVTSKSVAEGISDDLRQMSTEVRMGTKQLSDLAAQAGRMGAKGEEEILAFTETAAKMGAATTLSANKAGKSLGKMSAALNEPLGNVNSLADATNELSNNFQANSKEIVDTTQRAGQAMTTFGMSSQEILGVSAAFNEVSPSSRIAAQRMEQVSEAMMDPGNAQAFADVLGVTSEQFTKMQKESPKETLLSVMDAVEGNSGAMKTLNTELSNAQAGAFRDTASSADALRKAVETSNTAMEEGGSVAKENAQDMNTFAGQMDALKSQARNIGIVMGEAFLPILLDVAEIVGPLISGFADFNEAFDGLPAVIIAATAAIGGFTVALTMLTGVAATTLLPIIAALAAIGAAVYLAKKAWDENLGGIRDILLDFWDDLQPALESIRALLKKVWDDYAIPLIKELQAVWEKHFALIVSDVAKTMEAIGGQIKPTLKLLGEFWASHGEKIMAIIGTVFGAIELIVGTVMRAISTNIRVILALIRGDFGEALGIIKTFWKTTFKEIKEFLVGDWLPGVKATFALFFGIIKDTFKAIYNFLIGNSIVPKTFNEILNFITGWITTVKETFTTWLTTLFTTFKKYFTKLFTLWKTTLTKVYTRVGKFIKKFTKRYIAFWTNVYEFTVERLTAWFTFWKQTLTKLYTRVGTFMKKFVKRYTTFWTNIYEFTVERLTAWFTLWSEKLTQLYERVVLFVQKFVQRYTTFWTNIYEFTVERLTAWFTFWSEKLTALYERVVLFIQNFVQRYTTFWTNIYELSVEFLNRLYDFWTETFSDIYDFLTQWLGDLTSWISASGASQIASAFGIVADDSKSEIESMADSMMDTVSQLASDIVDTVSGAVDSAIDEFNSRIPSNLDFPSERIGGQSIDIPSVRVGDRRIGGGHLRVPSERIGGQSLDLPQLASGGIATADTLAQIGEGSQPEAIVPMDKMSRFLDTAYEVGASSMSGSTQTPSPASSGGQTMSATLRVEGDGALAELIEEHAELVVDDRQREQQDRIARL